MNKIKQIDIDDLTKKGITIDKLYKCYMMNLDNVVAYDVSVMTVSDILDEIENNSKYIVFFEIVEEKEDQK